MSWGVSAQATTDRSPLDFDLTSLYIILVVVEAFQACY